MTNNSSERSAKAMVALKLVPPLIRESLLNDQSFEKEYGIKTQAIISFGKNDVLVRRSELFDAVRTILGREGPVILTDTEDRTWNLTKDTREGELPHLVLTSDQQQLVLPDFSVLSGDTFVRIRSLEKSALDMNLPLSAQEKWRCILENRALEDDEVNVFHSDLRDTPANLIQTIQSEIMAGGESNVSSLVPNSRRYFERLVGAYDGCSSIRDYAISTGREVFRKLSEWRPYEGFLFSLLLSSHSALTSEINIDNLDKENLEKAFLFLEKDGDMLSLLGGLEVGFRILPNRPEVGPFLLRLIHRIRDDNVENKNSEFKLFSALFMLVDGELARTRLLAETPPFYRRLASLAQAALIHRILIKSQVDYQRIIKWAIRIRGEHFYMQSLADMRSEPRWTPDMADAPQMQADFLGRLMNAGKIFESNLIEVELRDTILGDGEKCLSSICKFPLPYLSGPLEGAEDTINVLPEEHAHRIEEELEKQSVDISSFISLVNLALIFRIKSDHAELAAKALKLGNYTLVNLKDKSQLLGILNGLATVAAVSRNLALADELRILVRRYRRDSVYALTIDESMRICLVASAARKDLMEWRLFAGEWLTELAFNDFEGDEGRVFHSNLLVLLHSVPELWVSCARAEAALQAWCSR